MKTIEMDKSMTKTLKDSEMFKQFINSSKLKGDLSRINFTTDLIDRSKISDGMSAIEKRLSYPGKMKVLELANPNKGKFYLVTNDKLSIPSYLSVMPMSNGKDVHVIVNLTNFIKRNGDIAVPTLYALLQNGLISYELITVWEKYTSKPVLMTHSLQVYVDMMMKVLDKLYGISSKQLEGDLVRFMLGKFFLLYMAGKSDNPQTNSMALKAMTGGTSPAAVERMESELPGDPYVNIFTLFETIGSQFEYEISIRSIVENYARMYGDNSILSMDYLPSFYQTVFSSVVSGNIVKDYIIENVTKKTLTKLYSEFFQYVD